jgi:hypothetical protein
VHTRQRNASGASQWRRQEFGASYGSAKEKLCDYDGAKLAVLACCSPTGHDILLKSFIVLGNVHSPGTPPPTAITMRIDQIRAEIKEMHWEALTKTRPLNLPLSG